MYKESLTESKKKSQVSSVLIPLSFVEATNFSPREPQILLQTKAKLHY